MSTLKPPLLPTTSPMNSIGASSRSSPMTIVPSIGRLLSLAAHGVDRRLVGGLLVAAPAQARSRHRRLLGHPHDLERQDALQHQMRLHYQ